MSSGDKKSTTVGFFTVVRNEQQGLFGGYLLVNRNARPIEFHCTAPVKPNRAQEILYGASLESYLYGEAIGAVLTAKAATAVDFLCVDVPAALAVREFVERPVALVIETDAAGATADADPSRPLFRIDQAHERGLHRFRLGTHDVAVARRYLADETAVTAKFAEIAEAFDLREPFERIRGAIDEARRGGR